MEPSSPSEPETWMTVQDVADYLKVNEETVRRWIRDRELPALRLGGRRTGYRIARRDLDRFVSARYGQVGEEQE